MPINGAALYEQGMLCSRVTGDSEPSFEERIEHSPQTENLEVLRGACADVANSFAVYMVDASGQSA